MSETEIYSWIADPASVETGLPMIATLTGFNDSGSCITQLSDHLFSHLDNELLLTFSNDRLLDYRSRRPRMFFEKDHITSYEPPTLAVYLFSDEAGKKFLLLDGYEPDFGWNGFSEAVVDITRKLQASSLTWMHAIPFPIPHTRDIGVTVSGNRHDLIDEYSEWKPQTEVPGNVLHLLEYKLAGYGVPVAGFVMLVPHYLGDSEMPQVALKAIELVSRATGLVLPSDTLRESGKKFFEKLEKQVQDNEELQKMIGNLEAGYKNSELGPMRAPIAKKSPEMPSADQIAEELEGYLMQMRRGENEEDE
ncbi:MAG TPA: PAC2 family protein [Microbacteriaceae bacterium]